MRLPQDRVRRRRLGALATVAAIAALAGMAVGSRDEGPDEAEPARGVADERAAPVAKLPLERQVGQLLMMSFDEPVAPAYIRRRLRAGEGAGVILFGHNVTDEAGLARLTRSLHRAAGGRTLIATDQEGGEIRNVPFAGPEISQSAVATPAAARAAAAEAARGLSGVGVNVNLAPVADVAPPAGGGALAGRLYPGAPEDVAELVAAAVRAHYGEGIATTVKHYPGLGRATVNTDDGSATIDAARSELEAADLEPFRAAVAADAPLVMASHALYPAFDPDSIASQSHVLLTDVLRGELGYRGVVVTDSIEAQAVLDRSDVATAAVRSIEAGADLVLMTGSGSWNLVYPRLLRRARRSPAFRARVEESARRVLGIQRRLRLTPGSRDAGQLPRRASGTASD
ncbi:MAG: glycoside hydrolase family 3 N-terminal domain-containing protein [Thermoleophilaceae bacterium]